MRFAKQILALLAIIATLPIFGQGAMLLGTNEPYSQWQNIVEDEDRKQSATTILQAMPVDEKVFRYPDGGETLQQGIDTVFLKKWLQFALASGVEKTILRADLYNATTIAQSIAAYRIMSASTEVLWVEASNEPYLSPWDDPKTTKEWWWSVLPWTKNRFYRLKANQYADRVFVLESAFIQAGYNITDKLAFASPVPVWSKGKEWYKTLKGRFNGKIQYVVLHLYGEPDSRNWITDTDQGVGLVAQDFLILVTEWCGLHFGRHGNSKYVDKAYTPEHKQWEEDIMDIMESHGVLVAIYHTYFPDMVRQILRQMGDFPYR